MEQLTSKKYFETISGDWDEMGNSFFGLGPRNAIMSVADAKAGEVVADIGCGTGYLTEGFDLDSVRVKAIDQSPEMLRIMAQKFGDNGSIEYIVGHSEALPVANGSVDIVVANMYLHHVENPAKAILEMARILKPGGTMAFTDLDVHEHTFLVTEQHDRWMGFDRADIIAWMNEAGLENGNIDCVGANCCANSSKGDEQAEISVFIASGRKI